MSSILTNTSAMVALQTLKGINKDLAKTQDMISTGKRVADAKDNAAIFAISKVMQSDVAGFRALSDSLSLGASTIAVASNATDQIGGLLEEIKGKIVAANEDNVDRSVLQDEIDQLRNQIYSVVDAAQFNGKNLLKTDEQTTILASLDRSSSGSVTSNSIAVNGRDFGTAVGTSGSDAGGKNASLSGTGVTGNEDSLVLTGDAAFLSDPADTLRVTIDGVEIDATVANIEAAGITLSTAGQATDEEVAQYIAGVINGTNDAGPRLQMQGVTATVTDDGSGNAGIDIASTSSEDITIASSVADNTGGNVAVGTALDAGTLNAVSGQINTAATVVFDMGTAATDGTDAGTEAFTVTVGESTFTYDPGASEAAAAIATNAAAAFNQQIADQGIKGLSFAANGTDLTLYNLSTTDTYDVSFDSSTLDTPGGVSQSAPTIGTATAAAASIEISGTILEGDSFTVSVDGEAATYVAGKNETVNDVIRGLQNVLAADGPTGLTTSLTFAGDPSTGVASLSLSSDTGGTVTLTEARGGTESTGDLYGLSTIDVSSTEGAEKALGTIENLIQINVDAQAEFGASAKRVDLQSDFISSLIDSFKTGIGGMVDTNMEEASARLQALQVQQQLATQSLTIANQAPQNILALFR